MPSIPAPRTRLGRRPVLPLPRFLPLLGELVSFEAAFVLFFFSNQIETLLGTSLNLTGPAFALSVLAGVAVILREGVSQRTLPSLYLGLLLVLWCLASYAWTPSRLFAPEKAVPLALFVTWTILASSLIIGRSRRRVVRLFVLLLGIAALLVAKGLLVYGLYGGFRGLRQQLASEEDAGTRIYLAWGRGVGPGAVLAFLIGIYARPLSPRQGLGLGFFAASAAFLLVSGGRGPLLAVAASCLLPLCIGFPLRRRRLALPRSQVLSLLLAAVAAAVVAFLMLSGSAPDTLRRMSALVSQLGDADRVVHSYDRVEKFARAWAGWTQAPVFGHGIGSFPLVSLGHESKAGDYPHNIVLELLFEFGLVGLVLFGLYLLASLSRLGLERLRADPVQLGCLMIFLNALLNAMTSADLPGNVAVFLGAGLLLVPRHEGWARKLAVRRSSAQVCVIRDKVIRSLVAVLRCRHDGLGEEAEEAERLCARFGDRLRAALARDGRNAEEEDAAIVSAVRRARGLFAEELERDRLRLEAMQAPAFPGDGQGEASRREPTLASA